MVSTIPSIDEKVDYFLHKIATVPNVTLESHDLYETDVLDEETCFIDQVMIERGLIKAERGRRIITGKGLEISNLGGWHMYQKLLRKESQRTFLESDNNLGKAKRENLLLKRKIDRLERELRSSIEKERSNHDIMACLFRQNKSDKLSLFLLGSVLGALLTLCVITLLS